MLRNRSIMWNFRSSYIPSLGSPKVEEKRKENLIFVAGNVVSETSFSEEVDAKDDLERTYVATSKAATGKNKLH